MTRLGSIEFDDRVLDALRDDKLVIFAGAGVSMGPPSNLPDFKTLALAIADGEFPLEGEPLDRFLGRLPRNIDVHERAKQLLQAVHGGPNALHQDLLRLFGSVEKVRVVTTNFDLHFETAAKSCFGTEPELFNAPALPLGNDFTGIVHVHGALSRAKYMVLTDVDFGRAYMTNGWAMRFLVDVFHRYVVLFVGYSHDDVIMHYLSRALHVDDIAGRFALIHTDNNWELLGITPIRFNKGTGIDAFAELYDGVRCLARYAAYDAGVSSVERYSVRDALEWQIRLTELGKCRPPLESDIVEEIEQALRETYTTRFLINVARGPEWIQWLNKHKFLDPLFGSASLGERDLLLALWVVEYYVIEHADIVIEIMAERDLRINPGFWRFVGREIGVAKDKPLADSDLKRWITILIACAPAQADDHVLKWLAERCASQGCVDIVLKLFLVMAIHRLTIRPGFFWSDDEGNEHGRRLDAIFSLRSDHWTLSEVWIKLLRPQIASIAQPLLSGIMSRLEDFYCDVKAWGKASHELDIISFGRSAIEPHEQDRHPEAIDVLIDASRDTLEWLSFNSPAIFEAWIERLVISEVPLLRRLAIHAITAYPRKSVDERIAWILDRIGLHGYSEYHEIHRAVTMNYSAASDATRQDVVHAIRVHTRPANDHFSDEERTARAHFEWFSYLLQAKPDCFFANEAISPIKAQYPDWRPSDHPDLTHWVGSAEWVGSQSPWSVEEMLARVPREQVDDLLTFKDSHFGGPDRDGLLATTRNACKQSSSWAFELAEVLAWRSLWSSDLWSAVFGGLQESDLSVDGWRELFATISRPELYSVHATDVARMLFSLVRDNGKPFALEVLDQANGIALPLWQALVSNEEDEDTDNWLSRAINRPAGVIVEFWIHSLSLLLEGKEKGERVWPGEYRQWLTMVVQDPTSKGGMGRCLLASQAAFLFHLDEEWTRTFIIPLFSDKEQQKFTQAWDGFLAWGRRDPALVEALLPAFIQALPRLGVDLPERRRRFIEYYTAIVVFDVSDPIQKLLPALFQKGSLEDRKSFASHLGFILRQMESAAKQHLWDSWLHGYWDARIYGRPAGLEDAEIQEMLDWLPDLSDAYPEGVSLVTRLRPISLGHGHLLFRLQECDLVTQFPSATAELLIYLCRCDIGINKEYVRDIEKRLGSLDPELRKRLDEGLARAGL